jgi:exopolyphosphatase / guanosine-5'-triphosphate,3'-diphosphate pyrophosphatase
VKRGRDISDKPMSNLTMTTHPSVDQAGEYAIIDLGSNSFHLHVIRLMENEWRHIDHHRDVVKLVDGLLPGGDIELSKQEEALQVLKRYGERIHGFHQGHVRIIGTSAFRHARKASTFFREAEAALGFPIDIVSGEEEARLIYLGIVSEDAPREKKRFIIDIGGGSTEFIYGEGRKPVCIDSVNLGNISLTKNVFEDGKLTPERFKTTVADIVEVLRATNVYKYRKSFQVVLGASGTPRLIATLITALELGSDGITPDALKKLTKKFVVKGKQKAVIQAGLPEERLASFPGALALMTGIMKAFELERIQITTAGVRQGIMHDMLLLPEGENRRRKTLTRWMDRHHVDRGQRDLVYGFAHAHLHEINSSIEHDCSAPEELLSWASDLHEIGLTINYSSYHKHGAYLIKNSDLPGFTREERGKLAFLVLNHRKRIKLDRLDPVDAVPMPLLFLFRMAWAIYRKRAPIQDPVQQIRVVENGFIAKFQPGWLHEHPLVAQQLAQEQDRWREVGLVLKLADR